MQRSAKAAPAEKHVRLLSVRIAKIKSIVEDTVKEESTQYSNHSTKFLSILGKEQGNREMGSMRKFRMFLRVYLTVLLIQIFLSVYINGKSSGSIQGEIITESNRHNQRGLEYYRKKQYKLAITEFQKALQLIPKNVEAQNNLGFVYWKIHWYLDSEKALLKTVSLDPKRAVAYLNLGDLYVDMDKPKEAIKAYEKFLELSSVAKNAQQIKNKITDLSALLHTEGASASAALVATFFKILYDELSEYCSPEADDETCRPEGWSFVEVDLRGTGKKDFIASPRDGVYCGSGGCSQFIYMQTAWGYKQVDIQWAEGKKDDSFFGVGDLKPSKRQVNGYLVLVGRYKDYEEYHLIESTPEGDAYLWTIVLVKLVWTGNAYEVRRMKDESPIPMPSG